MITRTDTPMHGMYQKADGSLWWWQYQTFTRTVWRLFGVPVFWWSHSHEDRPTCELWNGTSHEEIAKQSMH